MVTEVPKTVGQAAPSVAAHNVPHQPFTSEVIRDHLCLTTSSEDLALSKGRGGVRKTVLLACALSLLVLRVGGPHIQALECRFI